VRRREFIALAGGAAAMWPLGTQAQNAGRRAQDRVLASRKSQPGRWHLVGRKVRLAEARLCRGRDCIAPFCRRLSRLPELVAELIRHEIGVLIVVGPAAVRAAHRTSTVPIVAIDLETDPVRSGLIASLDRPGGNLTGLFMDQSSLAGKWIGLLRDAVPQIERVALMW
jgi:putative tryptophan/tyrosine transport system substrate-binding protein